MDNPERQAFAAYAKLPCHLRKVTRSLEKIREAMTIAQSCVSISWGKDSVVMLHLAQQIQPDIPCFNIGDRLEDLQNNYSEVVQAYCDRFSPNYQQIFYAESESFFNVVTNLAQHNPMTLIGCRSEESKYRQLVIRKYGAIHQYQSGKKRGAWRCFPLADWTAKDIWAYTIAHDLPYLRSYDQWGYNSRTAVVHNFDLHQGKHQEGLIRHGAMWRLKMQAPEYFAMYADLYPEIRTMT